MSDDQQPEDLRPIPDGGLKDTMPGWLKRPPAWRNMPSAEQRHERTLPEPDTSEIDPKHLVDVNDLPKWLQTIAARGEVPVPTPDQAVGHALQQIQAVSARSREAEPVESVSAAPVLEPPASGPVTSEKPDAESLVPAVADTVTPQGDEDVPPPASPLSPVIVTALAILILIVAIGAYFLV